MNPLELSLLSHVIESPQDDFPRRAYSDYLLDHGRGMRGEFIHRRLDEGRGCLREFTPDDFSRSILPFPAQLLPRIGRLSFWTLIEERGFVRFVVCRQAEWALLGSDLCNFHPIEEARLIGMNPQPYEFSALEMVGWPEPPPTWYFPGLELTFWEAYQAEPGEVPLASMAKARLGRACVRWARAQKREEIPLPALTSSSRP